MDGGGDPNHPPDLAIRPSSARHAAGQGADTQASWQVDTAQDIHKWGIAGRIWEAAYLFRTYLQVPESSSSSSHAVQFDPPCPLFAEAEGHGSEDGEQGGSSLHVLELGSGVGLVGLACANELKRSFDRASATVNGGAITRPQTRCTLVLTDLDSVVPLMQRNAESAGFSPSQPSGSCVGAAVGSSVDVIVRALPWGSRSHVDSILAELGQRRSPRSQTPPARQSQHQRRRPLDYVLCSDLVYFPELLAPLLRSLIHLTAAAAGTESTTTVEPPTVIIAYKIRSMAKEEPFWSALGCWFDVDIVACRYRHPANDRQHQQHEGLAQTPTPAEAAPAWGSWHRFGAWERDVVGRDSGGQANQTLDDGVASEDAYFVFVARRKPDTIAHEAPEDDAALLAGFMLAPHAPGAGAGAAAGGDGEGQKSPGAEEPQRRLVRGSGGSEFLEWALMGDIDMS
ncbi:unnamed protein product [Parajaminaea phylloscopi]